MDGGDDDEMFGDDSDAETDESAAQATLDTHAKQTGTNELSLADALAVFRSVVSAITARRRDKLQGARGVVCKTTPPKEDTAAPSG